MQEAIITTFIFWSTFVFSAGSFWIATMEAAPGTTFKKLYADYFLYLIAGWLPVAIICAILSDFIANVSGGIFLGHNWPRWC